MKITASKKTIVILSISFLLSLIAGIILLYKDVIHNGIKYGKWFALDKHEGEFIDCMEYKEEENEINAICQGFLLETEEKDASKSRGKLCKEFYIVYKDYQGWQKFSPCLNKEDFIYKDILTKPNHYIPVNIHIHYTKVNPFKYKLDNITLEDMGDEDLYVELIPNNMAVQQIIRNGKMITQSNLLSEKNGYLAIETGIDNNYPYMTYFKELSLKEIDVKDGKIRLLFTGEVKQQTVTITTIAESFLFSYYDEAKKLQDILINTKNYKEITPGLLYKVYFFSLSNKENEKLEDIISSCKNDLTNKEFFDQVFCNAGEEKIRNSVISDRNTYIDTLLNQNSENLQLEKFILYSLIKLD
ncbi:TPA: hypothetical protein GX533_02060 [Candidatus Dojkabacteria bacterium]|uniref:Uncharacterized protein n=1 Tax=Candidatus Dojkabacteria bacterium TaxID=2099670 RepID=A0A832QFA3_9BACT|nr:hypothetical protein [Candidatus Dojkabacteria bacterium]